MASLISIVPDIENHSVILNYDNNGSSFKQIVIIRKSSGKNVDIESLAHRILQRNVLIPLNRHSELIFSLLELNKQNYLTSTEYYEMPLLLQSTFQSFTKEFDWLTLEYSSVTMDDIDRTTELFYDELDDKIKGSMMILKLACIPENLKVFSKNDTLLHALSRVLREDGPKCLELTIYITAIFSQFSHFADFHHAISNYKVGSTCLEMVFVEILREESWSKELSQKRHQSETEVDNLKAKHSYEKLLVSYQSLVKKQNTFFKYALCLLMNIGEDLKLEYKIVNKGIVTILGKLLERNSQELLLVIVVYLKKLSIFKENLQQMKKAGIGKNLLSIMVHENDMLIHNTIKLCYNLMLDKDLKLYFIRSGFVGKIIAFLLQKQFVSVIVSCLYLVSCEPKLLTTLNAFPQIVPMLLEFCLRPVDFKPVLCSLLINMSTHANLALQIVECEEFIPLIKQCLENPCPEFMDSATHEKFLRLFRNISTHNGTVFRMALTEFRYQFVERFIKNVPEEELKKAFSEQQCECLLILANISQQCEDFPKLFREQSLFDFLIEKFEPKDSKWDTKLLKSSLFFLAASAHNSEICAFLLDHNIVKICLRVLNDLQDNDSVVLNVIYCFYVFVKGCGNEQRKWICDETKLIDYLFDLIYDRNYCIKNLCTATLDLIAEDHPELAEKIKQEKFASYNAKWLNVIQSDRSSDEQSNQSALEDMFLYPDLFLKMDILNDSSSDNLSEIEP